MEWIEARLLFQAVSDADAQLVMDQVYEVICRGHGTGKEHVCRLPFEATHGKQGWLGIETDIEGT